MRANRDHAPRITGAFLLWPQLRANGSWLPGLSGRLGEVPRVPRAMFAHLGTDVGTFLGGRGSALEARGSSLSSATVTFSL